MTVAFTMTERADQLHHDNAPGHATALVPAILSNPLQPRVGYLRLLAFPKLNSPLKERRFFNATVLLTFISVNATPHISKLPHCTSTPHPTGRHPQPFCYSDWSENEIVLLPLAEQFKFLSNKLKFP